MTSSDLLVDAYGRVKEEVDAVVAGLTADQLAHRIDPDANSIGWLAWHLTRVQDDHIADAAELDQVWLTDGWADRFALPFDPHATGYGHSSAEVAAVRVPSGDLLTGYHDAVYEQTIAYVEKLTDADLSRIVDTRWDPPVSLGVRLVSVIGDGLAHAGQAAYVRGVLERTGVR
ncbi:MAG: DUF664 domain-containing protein [Streptosporangiales bacterium]|nr:DUF664 domain-containing protein [Streptosporangiales bacterium]